MRSVLKTIAHEIGHVLSLNHSSCVGYIMGPPNVPRTVKSAECSEVAGNWQTDAEYVPAPAPVPPPPSSTGGGEGPCPSESCSPLILDINGDGIHTTTLENGVDFDLTGDGIPDRTAWTNPKTEEGILYFDLNHNHTVDGGRELFGDATRLPSGIRARHAFEALDVYDSPEHGGNDDGRIDQSDRVWGKLRIWVDRNHDGICGRDEDSPLAAAGVVEISLAYTTAPLADAIDAQGNYHLQQGLFIRRNGSKLTILDAVDVYYRVIYGR